MTGPVVTSHRDPATRAVTLCRWFGRDWADLADAQDEHHLACLVADLADLCLGLGLTLGPLDLAILDPHRQELDR